MAATPFRQVAKDFFVAPQLVAADFAIAQAAGIRTLINNRPDGEAPDQLSDAQARELAAANGLDYAFVPVVSGRMGPDDVAAFVPYVGVCHGGSTARRRDDRSRRRCGL